MGFQSLKHYSLVLLLTSVAFAAPQLRLTSTTVGPVSIPQGQDGPVQSLGAYNAGDGDLNLSFTSSAPWLSAQTVGSRPCSNDFSKTCIGINVALATSGLPAGTLTGTLRVTDPNAVDAPQDVIVTVQIGGGVPDSMTYYVAPNGSTAQQSIKTSTSFFMSASQPGGGVTLTLVQNGGGSYATTFGYNILVSADPSTAEGSYSGALSVFGSAIPGDNKTVPVNVQVTSQPIATAYPASLYFKAANGSALQTLDVNFGNSGVTELSVSGADTGSATWLSILQNGNTITAVADPAGLGNGIYTSTLTITSNAANPVTIPVTLEVVDAGPAVGRAQSVVSLVGNAPSTDGVALGDLVSIQGELFTTQSAQSADATQPLGTSLAGATVYINDIAAPLFSVSPSKIQFQVPYEINWGDSTVRVDRDGYTGNTLAVKTLPAAPKLIAVQNQNGDTVSTMAGGPQAPVAVGDTLTFTAYGFGQANPPVASGTPAPDGSALDSSIVARFSNGGIFGINFTVSPVSANLVTGTIGVYQVVVVVPDDAPHGAAVQVTIELPGVAASNVIYLNIP